MNAKTFLAAVNRSSKERDPHKARYSEIVYQRYQQKISYACSICGSGYDTVEKMLACLNQPVVTGRFVVGDLVFVGDWKMRPEWHDSPWRALTIPARPNSADHFERVNQTFLWHVVTSLWACNHEEVASLVALPGDEELSYGWNPTVSDTHKAMWREEEALAGDFKRGTNKYWFEELQSLKLIPPSLALRSEAKLLAESGIITNNLF